MMFSAFPFSPHADAKTSKGTNSSVDSLQKQNDIIKRAKKLFKKIIMPPPSFQLVQF